MVRWANEHGRFLSHSLLLALLWGTPLPDAAYITATARSQTLWMVPPHPVPSLDGRAPLSALGLPLPNAPACLSALG
ncbi:MAG: hypothetical protein R3E31_16215 [Chloroflexota bacterium]